MTISIVASGPPFYDERHKEHDMPPMDLTFPAGTFDGAARASLPGELTSVLLRAERAPDTDFFRSITWLYMNERPEGAVFQAGRPVEQPTIRLDVTVPQGALSDRRKEQLVSEATEVLLGAAGIPEAESLRVWVLVREVPEGNWGAAGNVVRFEMLKQAAAAERDGTGAGATGQAELTEPAAASA
jgi:phenylpyruvate tautomerase PptA (4-oxalocrotonate tautomerase family)